MILTPLYAEYTNDAIIYQDPNSDFWTIYTFSTN